MGATAESLRSPQRIEFDNVLTVLTEVGAACSQSAPSGPLTIDLANLVDFDSSAISMLFELARRRSAPVTVLNPPAKLAELAELYGVADLLFGQSGVDGQSRQAAPSVPAAGPATAGDRGRTSA
jgi:ABC-type transporter Mla MlaB component